MSALQVIGDPVLHSKSPLIHGAMLCELGLDTPYTAHVVKKGGLADYLDWAKANGITGFNATMPHKEDLLPFMDELGRDAARCGAVNPVCLRDGRLIGHNTAGAGGLAAREAAGLWPARRVVVLGAGGVSKAMALKLAASELTLLLEKGGYQAGVHPQTATGADWLTFEGPRLDEKQAALLGRAAHLYLLFEGALNGALTPLQGRAVAYLGDDLPACLRETGEGGVAATPTARQIARRVLGADGE